MNKKVPYEAQVNATDYANTLVDNYNTAYHNFTNAILTASTSYMAISVAALGPFNVSETMETYQKVEIIIAIVAFLIALATAFVAYIRDIFLFKKVLSIARKRRSEEDQKEYHKLSQEIDRLINKYNSSKFEKSLIIIQAVSFAVGTIFTVILLFSYLK